MFLPLTADDIVIGIFYYLYKEDCNLKLTSDRQSLHMAFENLKRRFPRMMAVFTFRKRETFAESPELDQALSNLHATGLIDHISRYYVVGKGLDICFSSFTKGILDKSGICDNQLKEAVKAIREALVSNIPRACKR